MTRRMIHRRTLLRGCGAAMGLPLLEGMSRLHGSQATTTPSRAVFFYVPNGVVQETWRLDQAGTDFEWSPTLEPLAEMRDKVSVYSNLDRVKVAGTDGHAQASTCWLSSAAPDELSPAGYPLKKTVDQIIASETGKSTPFRSLELSCNPFQDNRESIYFDNISWFGHGHVARSMRDPEKVFRRLFQVKPETRANSVLDLVMEDARSLRPQLGSLDRQKLDEYLQSVRSVETQIARLKDRRVAIERLRPQAPTVPWTELRRDQYIQLMGDLIILALRADLTRVASLMVAPERWGTPQMVHGLFESPIVHHSMTHAQNDPQVRRKLSLLDRYHVEQFASLVAKMDAVKEGTGTLLDSLLFTFGSGLSSGKTHVYSDLPIVIAGGGNGNATPGRHLRSPEGTPVANLWLAMARAMGVSLERIGDSTGAITLS